MKISNQRSAFVQALSQSAQSSDSLRQTVAIKCAQGHANFELIVKCSFNCFAKNELKQINSARQVDPSATMSRKIIKLSNK